jgi:hypothetical protein
MRRGADDRVRRGDLITFSIGSQSATTNHAERESDRLPRDPYWLAGSPHSLEPERAVGTSDSRPERGRFGAGKPRADSIPSGLKAKKQTKMADFWRFLGALK